MFDGNKAHETEAYIGQERISIVFYTISDSGKVNEEYRAVLGTVVFNYHQKIQRKEDEDSQKKKPVTK